MILSHPWLSVLFIVILCDEISSSFFSSFFQNSSHITVPIEKVTDAMLERRTSCSRHMWKCLPSSGEPEEKCKKYCGLLKRSISDCQDIRVRSRKYERRQGIANTGTAMEAKDRQGRDCQPEIFPKEMGLFGGEFKKWLEENVNMEHKPFGKAELPISWWKFDHQRRECIDGRREMVDGDCPFTQSLIRRAT